ncbi:MAG: hypothetical protein QOK42_480 [Frankiaceae bacterium]|nr:hypothetical protein [Frankiaceae bacterium]
MSLLRRATGAALLLLGLFTAVPGEAAGPAVELVTTVTAPGAVSGHIVMEGSHPRWFYLSSALGLIVYDISDPAAPREVGRLPQPTYQNEDLDGSGTVALLADDEPVSGEGLPVGGQLSVVSVSDKANPTTVAVASLRDGAGHTATCLDGCRWAYASGGGTLAAVDLRVPAKPVVSTLPAPAATGTVHDGEQDRDGVLWLSGVDGMAALATRPVTTLGERVRRLSARATPTKPVILTTTGAPHSSGATRVGILHSSLRPADIHYRGFAPGDVVLASEEFTADACGDGGRFHTFDARGVRTGAPLRLLDSVAPQESSSAKVPVGLGRGCSAHWFTTSGSLVAVAWYGAGTRILDVSDPRHVRQVGRYVPTEPRVWAAYWIPGTPYVYSLDLDRGIDVLRVSARPGGPEVAPLSHGVRPAAALQARVLDGMCR